VNVAKSKLFFSQNGLKLDFSIDNNSSFDINFAKHFEVTDILNQKRLPTGFVRVKRN